MHSGPRRAAEAPVGRPAGSLLTGREVVPTARVGEHNHHQHHTTALKKMPTAMESNKDLRPKVVGGAKNAHVHFSDARLAMKLTDAGPKMPGLARKRIRTIGEVPLCLCNLLFNLFLQIDVSVDKVPDFGVVWCPQAPDRLCPTSRSRYVFIDGLRQRNIKNCERCLFGLRWQMRPDSNRIAEL